MPSAGATAMWPTEMSDDFDRAAQRLDPARLEMYRLMSRIVITVEAEVKRHTRVRTGTLKRSWTSEVQRAGERGVVGTTIVYAPYQRNKPAEEGLAASRDTIDQLLREAGMQFFSGVVQ
jgi:hypothetical protein